MCVRAAAHARVLPMLRVLVLALALSARGSRSDRDCAPGCEAVGNCNRDTGTCECPVGRSGGISAAFDPDGVHVPAAAAAVGHCWWSELVPTLVHRKRAACSAWDMLAVLAA
eukprot:365378-Chlamydomonas_euryale.AAC.8